MKLTFDDDVPTIWSQYAEPDRAHVRDVFNHCVDLFIEAAREHAEKENLPMVAFDAEVRTHLTLDDGRKVPFKHLVGGTPGDIESIHFGNRTMRVDFPAASNRSPIVVDEVKSMGILNNLAEQVDTASRMYQPLNQERVDQILKDDNVQIFRKFPLTGSHGVLGVALQSEFMSRRINPLNNLDASIEHLVKFALAHPNNPLPQICGATRRLDRK